MHARRGTVQLKDEVYRQMFRLEEGRPGAEMGLAVVLLHAWIAADAEPKCREDRDWLKKISPICLQMIEASLKANATALTNAQ
jgi:hypothetical protein